MSKSGKEVSDQMLDLGRDVRRNPKQWKSMNLGVETSSLFREIAEHSDIAGSPGILTGLEIIKRALHKIATRAIQTQDKVILAELELIGVIKREEQEEVQ